MVDVIFNQHEALTHLTAGCKLYAYHGYRQECIVTEQKVENNFIWIFMQQKR